VIRLVPAYIQHALERRLLKKYLHDSFKTESPDSFKTEIVFVETDEQTYMARSTQLLILVKNISRHAD